MIDENHPFHFLKKIFDIDDSVFLFSRYVYLPDSLLDEREVFSVNGEDVTESFVSQSISVLRQDQELAIHSNVFVRGRRFHIPMIDFSMEDGLGYEVFDRITRYISRSVLLNMAVYSSGRSFHAYSTTLLTPKEWIEFMGRLLLINPKGSGDIVDSRWVGHRLIGGFGALRWSNNSGLYLGEPSRVRFPN